MTFLVITRRVLGLSVMVMNMWLSLGRVLFVVRRSCLAVDTRVLWLRLLGIRVSSCRLIRSSVVLRDASCRGWASARGLTMRTCLVL